MMNTRLAALTAALTSSLLGSAQNNPIFTGGPGDGWATDGYQQEANNIFSGGAGDGWASNGYQQSENNIFTGGSGDGWANDNSPLLVIEGPNAVEEDAFSSAVHAYPNPTDHQLNIELSGNWGTVDLEVIDAAGKLVRSERFVDARRMVAVIDGAHGLYLVKLSTEAGESTTLRVLKR